MIALRLLFPLYYNVCYHHSLRLCACLCVNFMLQFVPFQSVRFSVRPLALVSGLFKGLLVVACLSVRWECLVNVCLIYVSQVLVFCLLTILVASLFVCLFEVSGNVSRLSVC